MTQKLINCTYLYILSIRLNLLIATSLVFSWSESFIFVNHSSSSTRCHYISSSFSASASFTFVGLEWLLVLICSLSFSETFTSISLVSGFLLSLFVSDSTFLFEGFHGLIFFGHIKQAYFLDTSTKITSKLRNLVMHITCSLEISKCMEHFLRQMLITRIQPVEKGVS